MDFGTKRLNRIFNKHFIFKNKMFNLPVDIIRHIFKILLTMEPLYIFNFPDEWFTLAECEDEDKRILILNCIKYNFKLTNIPLLELLKPKKFKNIINKDPKRFISTLNFLEISNENKYLIYSDKILLNENYLLNLEILKWLIERHNFKMENYCSFLAVKNNDLEMLKWISGNLESAKSSIYFLCYHAVKRNNFKILKWLRSQCIDLGVKSVKYEWNSSCCSRAAKNGNLKILKWLRNANEQEEGEENNLSPCPWDINTLYESIINKKLKVMNWIIKNSNFEFNNECVRLCIVSNNLDALKIIDSFSSNMVNTKWNTFYSIKYNKLEILKFLITKEKPCPLFNSCFAHDYKYRTTNLEIINFLYSLNLSSIDKKCYQCLYLT
jgi:hypothetical protein